MNKKYIELAEQAGFGLWGKESWNPGDVIDWSARYDKELETLCDLIVQECLSNMEDCDGDLDFAIWTTKKEFGVKE